MRPTATDSSELTRSWPNLSSAGDPAMLVEAFELQQKTFKDVYNPNGTTSEMTERHIRVCAESDKG